MEDKKRKEKNKRKKWFIWGSVALIILGIGAKSRRKISALRAENEALIKENENLGRKLNEAWYQVGKLGGQLFNNKEE